MLKTEKLTKYYGNTLGVKDIDLTLNNGEIFGLLGPNGAGKSTFINVIMGLINKTSGDVYIDNQLVLKKNGYKEIVGFLPSEVHLYKDLTVEKMINYAASFYKKDLTERINYLVSKLKVPLDKKIGDLSFGNLKKVGIVIAMMHSPKLLILDEPTNGLDPLMTETFFKLLEEEKKKGVTILFSTHILSEVRTICDRVGFLKDGKLIEVVDVKEILKNEFNTVTVIGTEFKKMKLPMKDIMIKKQTKNSIKFIYKGDINNLIKIVSDVKIDNLIIEEPSVEDLFMNYYK